MWQFLAGAVGPLAKRVLVALGIGVVSYAGVQTLLDQVRDAVTGAWGQLGGSTLQLLTLGGFPESVGIILGALAARVGLMALEQFGRVTG